MARILMAIAVVLLANAAALAQTTAPPADGDAAYAPIPPPGPIVGGKHIQPTQSDIMEREAVRQPGQSEAAPQRGSDGSDKELDELYQQVLKQSQQR